MSLRKEKREIEVLIAMGNLLIIFTILWIGIEVLGPVQDKQITEYCMDNPNGTLQGDIIINCSEWLEDHPELVGEIMVERRGR